MAAKRPAAKKAVPAKRTPRPSAERRIASLESEVAELREQIGNIAKFIAAGVAKQIQDQLINAGPEQQAAFAELLAGGIEGGR